jgi:hypothetical protein
VEGVEVEPCRRREQAEDRRDRRAAQAQAQASGSSVAPLEHPDDAHLSSESLTMMALTGYRLSA